MIVDIRAYRFMAGTLKGFFHRPPGKSDKRVALRGSYAAGSESALGCGILRVFSHPGLRAQAAKDFPLTIWLIGIGCLALGLLIGVAFGSRFGGGSARVRELEEQMKRLRDSDREYRESVSEHFGTTAELVKQLTENYKDVYQHLANGAQSLCSVEVASRLLPASSDSVFEEDPPAAREPGVLPPKDYAAKQDPSRKGALAEDFGLEKPKLKIGDEQVSDGQNP